MTSPDLQSGSDRVHAVSQKIASEIVVNIQGDEPMLRPAHIDALLAPFDRPEIDAQVTTLWTPCTAGGDRRPQCGESRARGRRTCALFFARDDSLSTAIAPAALIYRKHLGLYAYRRAALERFASVAAASAGDNRASGTVRLLAHNIPIYVEQTPHTTIGVDTEDDLDRVAAILADEK